jgi:hypothetical protein
MERRSGNGMSNSDFYSNNVKFTYENGKMTLPPGGEKLWHAIEPPHAGAGLSEEDAVPFAEDVPPPK